MTEEEERERISDSLIRFLIINWKQLKDQTVPEIYNAWSLQSGMTIKYPSTFAWALNYVDQVLMDGMPDNIEILPELLTDYQNNKKGDKKYEVR